MQSMRTLIAIEIAGAALTTAASGQPRYYGDIAGRRYIMVSALFTVAS
jgi:hypothetical protein